MTAGASPSPGADCRASVVRLPFPPYRIRHRQALWLILLLSFALRLALVANGGQMYWPDETRYWTTVAIADKLHAGEFKSVAGSLLQYRLHAGYHWAGIIPAYLHRLVFALQGNDGLSWFDDYWRDPTGDFRFSAVFFAMPSVLSIGMIYLIALKAGAKADEALLAAFLLAASNSWFVYSRHFQTYDASLFLGLVAVYAALRLRGSGFRGAVLMGLLMFCAFWVYFTHYFLMFAIAFLYCALLARKPLDLVIRPIGILLGALLLLAPIVLYSSLILDIDVFSRMRSIGYATTGDYDEGLLLPFLYYRDAESLVSLIWAVGLVAALAQARKQRPEERRRAILWLSCLALLYLSMCLFSTGLQVLALAGRFVRPMTPFVVLLCAYAFAPLLKRLGFKLSLLLLAAICLVSASNFLDAIRLRFYREIAREVLEEYDPVSFETTFLPPSRHINFPIHEARDDARYILVNAGFYDPVTEMRDRPAGEVLLEIPHPYNFKPYQYEHRTLVRKAREIINRDGVTIWLIDTQAAAEG